MKLPDLTTAVHEAIKIFTEFEQSNLFDLADQYREEHRGQEPGEFDRDDMKKIAVLAALAATDSHLRMHGITRYGLHRYHVGHERDGEPPTVLFELDDLTLARIVAQDVATQNDPETFITIWDCATGHIDLMIQGTLATGNEKTTTGERTCRT